VVVGDTHGHLDRIKQEVKSLSGIDLLLHTGDYYRDGVALAKHLRLKHYSVIGNCDPGVDGPKEVFLNFEGHRIMLTHGHLQSAKRTLNNLDLRAQEKKASIVVFGHTHVPYLEKVGGIWFMNPGSPFNPRAGYKPTYGLLQISGKELIPSIIEIAS
jgi:putative phosphoesterase